MATTQEMTLLKETQQSLDSSGVPGDIISRARPTAQWYRADGFALPSLLPADAYHIQRYTARGWSMVPPLAQAEATIAEVQSGIAQHAHRYGRALGSPCLVDGCEVVRKTAFAKRKKRS